MLIKKPNKIKSFEITSERNYINRRNFIKSGCLIGGGIISDNLLTAGYTTNDLYYSENEQGYVEIDWGFPLQIDGFGFKSSADLTLAPDVAEVFYWDYSLRNYRKEDTF